MVYEFRETLLKIEGLNKSYGGVPILRDISLEIKNIYRPDISQGQIISLVGRSGSGKSTLFRLLAGLEQPDTGTITRLDKSALDLPNTMEPVCEGDMGVVFQNSYVFPWRKVKSILQKAIRHNSLLASWSSKQQDDYLGTIIGTLTLEDHLNKYTNQLSGGQRQRVAIAEQIINGGNFILLDEPLSGLDTLTIDRVMKTLIELSLTDEYKTLILISHDLSNSLAISDTAFILAKEEGKEGATITHQICLATQGLAWQPNIKENPIFRDLLNTVKTLL
jgi:ABC-type nitrate/sulfonate/bicarbonate transport system ATPase subunit